MIRDLIGSHSDNYDSEDYEILYSAASVNAKKNPICNFSLNFLDPMGLLGWIRPIRVDITFMLSFTKYNELWDQTQLYSSNLICLMNTTKLVDLTSRFNWIIR